MDLYDCLIGGEEVDKQEFAARHRVIAKSVQRDIADIRTHLQESGAGVELAYDRHARRYRLGEGGSRCFTCMEVLALVKILLESRAFPRPEMEQLVYKLLARLPKREQADLRQQIADEKHNYRELEHRRPLLKAIWDVSGAIKRQRVIRFAYTRQDGKAKERVVRPVAVTFSDFYFYVIGYIEGVEKEFPAVFRLDRCMDIRETGEAFFIPYRDRFQLGEFRSRIQFMYPGELVTVRFAFWGSSLEAVLDRLPTARILGVRNGRHVLEATVYGTGVLMWFLTQRQYLEVLSPPPLREEMAAIASSLHRMYGQGAGPEEEGPQRG